MTLHELNQLPEPQLLQSLMRCCASPRWCRLMAQSRPFASEAELKCQAEAAARQLGDDDWLEAFAAHPQIGDVSSLAKRFADTQRWAGSEQAATALAKETTLYQLAKLNKAYLQRHGFIFILFATGKSAEQMLTQLQARLDNSSEDELTIAASEQLKITQLRLQKLLGAAV